MTNYFCRFFSDRCVLKTATVKAVDEAAARRAAAKIFGLRAHLWRIEVQVTDSRPDEF